MPNATVIYDAEGRTINATTGAPGQSVTVQAQTQIQYSASDLDGSGWVGSPYLCLKSYSLIRLPNESIIEMKQPVIIEPIIEDQEVR